MVFPAIDINVQRVKCFYLFVAVFRRMHIHTIYGQCPLIEFTSALELTQYVLVYLFTDTMKVLCMWDFLTEFWPYLMALVVQVGFSVSCVRVDIVANKWIN